MNLRIAFALALSLVTVGLVQQKAARAWASAKERDEVYLLPPPQQLEAMSLGYRSALADLMWADALVTQGLRLQERRHYDTLVPLLDGITALDPQFREPYLLSDALITFQSVPSTREDAYAARRILELGVKNRPLDGELWLNLGTFVCYLAPSSILTDPNEQLAWREQGALYLERAVELSGNDANLAFQALGGGARFARMGERSAAIRFYRKVLEATDNEELRAEAQQKLDTMLAEEQRLHASDAEALQTFLASEETRKLNELGTLRPILKHERRQHYAGLTMEAMMVLGPPRPSPQCAGTPTEGPCSATWKVWASYKLPGANATLVAP